VGVLGKVRGHWEKKYAESKELIEKQREVEEKEVKEIVKKDVKGKDVVREGQKEGAPIDKIRAAIQHQVRERKAQLERQREAEREGVKKVGKEVEGKGE